MRPFLRAKINCGIEGKNRKLAIKHKTLTGVSYYLLSTMKRLQLAALACVLTRETTLAVHSRGTDDDVVYQSRIQAMKLHLWLRGEFAYDSASDADAATTAVNLEMQAATASFRHGPIREVRQRIYRNIVANSCRGESCLEDLLGIRGGDGGGVEYATRLENKLAELGTKFGQPFLDAIEKNKAEHAADCKRSCELFYCANDGNNSKVWESTTTSFRSYSFGAVPPEDFHDEFQFPLDLIKVTQGEPLFSAEESAQVIKQAEAEGVAQNEYKSGKYKLGGDWLVNLPQTREWFNKQLEHTMFPILCHLFPEIIRSPSVLRAHSVSLLKYNSTHPRTDVHIDNGILAMTLAMSPQSDYFGGGTFYEHMGVDHVLPMDVGHGTFRPGSVRHGGHRVTAGSRYILGAFLLLEDHVEHVRRLKNRGAELRTSGDLADAVNHFEWALALNPRCTTCLKDWAEILLSQGNFAEAEKKIRDALELLEDQDSDALFTLGLILSEQGKDEESIAVYKKSIELNGEDAELCYNLGIKLGEQGDTKGELAMYKKAVSIDQNFGGAYINMGTILADNGDLASAEVMFLKAIQCGKEEVRTKAMFNLSLLLQQKANSLATSGDLTGAKAAIVKASKLLDDAKPLIDARIALGGSNSEDAMYASQFKPMRVQCHRLLGQVLAGIGDMQACEVEFRLASEKFADIPGIWLALSRVLELQGKMEEAEVCKAKFAALQNSM
jgi:tetratricopeptide (TPR) repeat protein